MFKKRFMSAALVLLIVLSVFTQVSATDAPAEETRESAEEKAGRIAQVLVSYYGVSSLQYAVIDNGEIVISGSQVSPIFKDTVTDETMYGIGSLSKVYTTTAVMQLVEDGKIDLDKAVTEYIPEFTMKDERYKDITVRMLLNHSSGIYGTTYTDSFMFDVYNPDVHNNILSYLSEQNLKADPGEIAVYCNDGFTLAEIVVERVSGTDFTSYLQEKIFAPLELSNTDTPAGSFDRSQLATAYNTGGEAMPVDTLNVIGTGGIYSTASDVVTFAQAFMSNSNGIISEESAVAMAEYEFERGIYPDIADSVIDYGLGWDSVRLFPFNRYEIQALTKGGDTLLYHTALVVLPEYNMAMAVLTAGGASTYGTVMASGVLLDLLLEKGEIEEVLPDIEFEKAEPIELPDEYNEYFGYYATLGGIVKVEKNEDGTSISLSSLYAPEQAQTCYYIGEGIFYAEDLSVEIKFVKEDNGETYIRQLVYQSLPYIGQVAMNIYSHQKIETKTDSVDEDVAQAWAARNGKAYLLVSEAFNSQSYSVGGANVICASVIYVDEVGDYIMQNKIVDADTAVNILKIPGLNGRDSTDYVFYDDGGVEYLSAANLIFADADSFSDIYHGRTSHTTINDKGHSKWYSINEKAAGKTMTVNVPENSAFAVYDKNLSCIFYSYAANTSTVMLPEDGAIVFIGEAGTVFNITLE